MEGRQRVLGLALRAGRSPSRRCRERADPRRTGPCWPPSRSRHGPGSSACSSRQRSRPVARSAGRVMVRSGHGRPGPEPGILGADTHRRAHAARHHPTATSHAASRRRRSSRSPRPASSCSGAPVGAPRSALAADPALTPRLEAPAAADPRSDPLGTTVRFFGRGYGHGVGMSPIRRAGPRPGGPDRGDDPRPLLPGHDPRIDRRRRRRSGSSCCPTGRPRRRAARGLRPAGDLDDRRRRRRPSRPMRARASIPTTTSRRPARRTTWRCGSTPRAARSCTRRRSRRASSSARGGRAHCSSCGRSHPRYDTFRGALRISPRRRPRRVSVVDELPLETYLRGVVPVEMPVDLADRRRSRRRRSRRARTPLADCARASRTTTSPTTRARRSTTASQGEKAATNAVIVATAGVVLRSGGVDRQHAVPFDRRRRDREQRERLRRRRPARRSPAPVSYLRGSSGPARRTAAPTTRRRRTRRGRRDVHARPSCRPGSPPTRGRTSGR